MTEATAEAPNRTLHMGLAAAGISPYLVNGYVNAHIAKWPALYWTVEFLFWFVIPAIVFTLLARRTGLRPADLGLHAWIFGRQSISLVVATCLVFSFLAFVVYYEANLYFSQVFSAEGVFRYHSVLPESGHARTLVAIYFALTAGIVEELYFRGLLAHIVLSFRHAGVLYLLVSPILFAAVHWEAGAATVGTAYVFGLFATVAYTVIRNLWPLVIGHIYTDYIVFRYLH